MIRILAGFGVGRAGRVLAGAVVVLVVVFGMVFRGRRGLMTKNDQHHSGRGVRAGTIIGIVTKLL